VTRNLITAFSSAEMKYHLFCNRVFPVCDGMELCVEHSPHTATANLDANMAFATPVENNGDSRRLYWYKCRRHTASYTAESIRWSDVISLHTCRVVPLV
jgi:hypothetical protein